VHTPRLLLASKGPQAPDGLGNESGVIGRNFMETLFWTSSGLHPEPLGSHRGVPSDSICWDFNAPDAIPGIIGGCRFTSGAAQAGLNGPIAYANRVVGGWGRDHKARMRATFGRVLTIVGIGESLPNSNSYVDLDPERSDAAGMPLARIHSHLEEMEVDRLAFVARTARDILRASGVDKIIDEYGSYDAFNATHVFGTCRMGRDSEQSVVDPYGRSHRWGNLFVVDASVFPSSGGGEAPSLTIEALGIRTARHLGGLLARGEI
jgi:choline dehydrogenase-like flavoprotein